MEQGTNQWHRARLGKPTASQFKAIKEKWEEVKAESTKKADVISWLVDNHRETLRKAVKAAGAEKAEVMTMAQLKPVYDRCAGVKKRVGYFDGAETYANECLAEALSGVVRQLDGPALRWGHEQEPNAVREYEIATFQLVKPVGFVPLRNKTDGRIWTGASPDGLVGHWLITEADDGMAQVEPLDANCGGLEIKCPYNAAVHMATLRSGQIPKEHLQQMYGNMLCTGAAWWDFVSYHPEFGAHCIFIKRLERDEAVLTEMASRVRRFDQYIQRELKKQKS